MYDELIKRLRTSCESCKLWDGYKCCLKGECSAQTRLQAADAIEELQRICDAMKPKYDTVCVKCAYYAEAEYNDKGFLICPASGMDITAWDFCSYFEPLPEPPKEE